MRFDPIYSGNIRLPAQGAGNKSTRKDLRLRMTQEEASVLDGGSPFYSKPELLTLEDHGALGINPSAASYDFLKSVRVVPVTMLELTAAQRHYPVVFSSLEQATLLAVVGVLDDTNLFVEADGAWRESTYVPAYARCYPFALATGPDDQFAVVIDSAAPMVAENAEQPFFDGSSLSTPIQQRVDHCMQYDAQNKATRVFCDRLAELKLLKGQEVTFNRTDGGEEIVLGSYVAVDFAKVKDLDSETLQQFHTDGTLAAIYAHRFSLDLWWQLLDLRNRLKSAD